MKMNQRRLFLIEEVWRGTTTVVVNSCWSDIADKPTFKNFLSNAYSSYIIKERGFLTRMGWGLTWTSLYHMLRIVQLQQTKTI